MSNNKIYLAINGKVEEVEILKETDKTYKLGRNSRFFSTLRKINVNTFDKMYRSVFSFNSDEAIKIYNEGIQSKIDDYLNYAKSLSKELIKQPILLEDK